MSWDLQHLTKLGDNQSIWTLIDDVFINRINNLLRQVPPEETAELVASFDQNLRKTICDMVGVEKISDRS
jgi:flagellar motor switch protein FliG